MLIARPIPVPEAPLQDLRAVDVPGPRSVRGSDIFDDFRSITYLFDNIPSSVLLPNTRRSACPPGRFRVGPVVVR